LDPFLILDWLYDEALRIEDEEKQKAILDSIIYSKPVQKITKVSNNYKDDEEVSSEEDTVFGIPS